jgi:hypothetical protein
VAYATSFGLLCVPCALDLVWWCFARSTDPPHRSTAAYRWVRALYTAWYGCLLTEIVIASDVPGVSVGVLSLGSAAFAMRVTNELQWAGTLGAVAFFGMLLVPMGGDASIVRVDFSRTTHFWLWFWLAARLKAQVAGLINAFVSKRIWNVDPKWDAPRAAADAAFYRRYSSQFFTWSIVSAVCMGGFVANHPGFAQHAVDEYVKAWGVFASDAGFAGMRDVRIPFT